MKTIAFISGKGGVGKSTLCFLTALGIKEAGQTVSVEDLDPQLSITSWLDDSLIQKQGSADYHLIDTRPAIDAESVHDAIKRADTIILPCSPSPADLTAVKATLDVIAAMKNEETKVFVALNCVKPGTNLTSGAPELIEDMGVALLNSAMPDRQCIQRATMQGWKALDSDTQTKTLKLTIATIS